MIWNPIGGDTWTSGEYRIVRKILGSYDAWKYSLGFCGILERDIKTLDEAKAICETHNRGDA